MTAVDESIPLSAPFSVGEFEWRIVVKTSAAGSQCLGYEWRRTDQRDRAWNDQKNWPGDTTVVRSSSNSEPLSSAIRVGDYEWRIVTKQSAFETPCLGYEWRRIALPGQPEAPWNDQEDWLAEQDRETSAR